MSLITQAAQACACLALSMGSACSRCTHTERVGCCRATRALYYSGTTNIEQVIQWIVDHENDPDLEQPLLVPKVRPLVG